ncbi:hypothetical protein J6590_023202 [Homalodisca vitripennis]|nr:hypothetical protein J6590_023202 [Homalodisca vitripennis]
MTYSATNVEIVFTLPTPQVTSASILPQSTTLSFILSYSLELAVRKRSEIFFILDPAQRSVINFPLTSGVKAALPTPPNTSHRSPPPAHRS